MNLLDRHILKSVLFTCAAAVALFSFIVALPNVIKDLLGPLLAGQITADRFVRLIGLLFPFAISFALPMGILTGVLLTLGRLSADSEVTAMRAAGLSVGRISRPVIVLGLLGALGALYVNFQAMPAARVQYHTEFTAAIRQNPLSFIVPKTFIREFRGAVIYVGERQGNLLRDIWVWRLDPEMRVTTLERSAAGRVEYDEVSDTLEVTLTPAQIESRNKDNPEDFSRAPSIPVMGRANPPPIPVSRYLSRERMKPEWQTFTQLRAEHARLLARLPPPPEEARERARENIKPALVMHEKFNLSLAVLSFALIGVPLGIKVSRRETSANLGLALVLVLGFYILTMMVKWLDRHPEYRPDLLLWLPNVLFIGLAIWLFRRIEK